MDLPWFISFTLILELLKNSEAQTSQDKYIITSSLSTNYGLYIYPGDASVKGQPSVISPTGNTLIRNIETNTASAAIYYLDLESKCIYNVTNFASPSVTLNKMHCGISRSTASTIAYDWVTGNMYWSDGIFHWIVLQPIMTTDIHMYKKVISSNVKDISALAIEPIKRYIFWFDDSPTGARIERASLAGLNRRVVLTNGFRYVSDIVADVKTDRIFWVDHYRYSIESASYEGLERKVIYKELNAHFLALAVDLEYVCMTFPTNTLWACARKSTGQLIRVERLTQISPYGITIFNKDMQPAGQDYCAAANCEHLCVNGDVKAICMCKEGYYLNQDERSCTANHTLFGSGILLSYDQELCMMDFRAINHGTGVYLKRFMTGLQGVTHISADAADLLVYYTNSVSREIKSYSVVGSNVKVLQTFTGNVSGLSFDWLQKKLYWCESNTGLIRRISTDNGISEIFADTKLEAHSVTVDPFNRTVFWIQQKNKIISSSMSNGNVQTVLVQGGLKSGLFFDATTYRIFWIEYSTIKSMKIDGTKVEIHKAAKQGSPLMVYKSYAVWLSGELQIGTIPLSTDHSQSLFVSVPNYGKLTGFTLFDIQDQPQKRDACDNESDQCDHICIPTDTGRVCRCEFGFTLDADNKTCQSVPFTQRFMLTADLLQSRIYQVSLDTGETRSLKIPLVERPTNALYDANNKLVYWADVKKRTIFKSRIDISEDAFLIYTCEVGTYPDSIITDPTTQYLYFSISDSSYKETTKGYISVLNSITLQSKTLISGLGLVHGLVLFPSKGLLFFLDEKSSQTIIYSAPMDGSYKTSIISSTDAISALTVDIQNDRLFWSVSSEIRTSDITGQQLRIFISADNGIRNMLYANPYLYYSSDKQQKIVKIDANTKQPVNWMADAPELGILLSLDITPKESVKVHALCANSNGQCSTFCLPRHSSRTCACQDGVLIYSDGKTCIGVVKCSDSIKFGSLESECQRYPSETCNFTCDTGYTARVAFQSVVCQENSSWNYDLSTLCVTQCPEDFANGDLEKTCRRFPNETCRFSCDSGYSPIATPETVICQQNSSWSHNLSDICVKKCPDDVANVTLDRNCRRFPGEACSFSCDSGHSPKVTPQTLICQQNSTWNYNFSDICVPIPNNFILVTDSYNKKIYKIDIETQNYEAIPLLNHHNPICIDYDPTSDKIYWTDVTSKQIKSADLNGNNEKIVAQLGVDAIMDGLAVDVPSQLLFYTDTGNDIIAAMHMDGSLSYDIIYENLDEPRAIVTDPVNGIIYWTDWGSSARIEQANYDGKDRKVIINTGLGWPNGLAVDVIGNKLYWCDAKTHLIESSNMDGSNRIVLLNEASIPQPAHYFGIALDRDTLYFTDWKRKSVMKIKADSTGLQRFGSSAFGRLNDIHVYSYRSDIHKVTNGCSNGKGGCSHICLPVKFNGRICVCPKGLFIQPDGVSCDKAIISSDILLFSDSVNRQIYRMDLNSQHYQKIPLSTHYTPICIDYDPLNNRIYWTDVSSKQIKMAGLDGTEEKLLVQLNQTAILDGLALDVPSQLLFYTDTGNDVIVVMTMDASYSKVIVNDTLDEPRAIVTDPVNGIIYWTDWGAIAKIEMAYYDGSNRQNIINTGLSWPNGLAVDASAKKMYWCDGGTHKIEAANLDGSNRIVVLNEATITPPAHYFGLALFQDTLYFTDWKRRNVMKIKTDGTGLQTFGPPYFGRLNDIHVYKKGHGSSNVTNACSKINNGCSHICLPRSSNNRVCLCPDGLFLQSDGVSCSESSKCPEYFVSGSLQDCRRFKSDTCNFTCDAGFLSKVTPQIVVCENNYTWNYDLNNICVKGCAEEIQFGTLEPTCKRFPNEICRFACDAEFSSKVPSHTIVCQQNSSWDHDLSDICVKKCTGQVMFGSLDLNCNHFPNEACSFTCDAGYSSKLTSQKIVCQGDSKWDQDLLDICVKKCTGQVKFGSLDSNCNHFPNETCSFTCDAGYSSKLTSQKIVCESNSKWNQDLLDICVKKCTDQVQFGSLERSCKRFPNDTCSFVCDDGFSSKVTPQIISCQDDSSWDRDLTDICIRKCTGQAKFGSLDENCNHFPNEKCNFTCDAGYSTKLTPQTIICKSNGTWDQDLSDICGKKCRDQIQNGTIDKNCSRFPNVTCSFECDNGYSSKVPSKKILCQRDSSWDQDISDICVKKCTGEITFGSKETNCNHFPNDVCTFTCDAGFSSKLNPQTIVCQGNSTWDQDLSDICVKKCSEQITFGFFDKECTRFPTETCRFSCNDGYSTVVTPQTIICQNNSTWNYDLSNLCVKKCVDQVEFGSLADDCKRLPTETCDFTCKRGYMSKLSPQTVMCQKNSTWNHDLSSICSVACEDSILNGKIDQPCLRIAGVSCSYNCNPDYEKDPQHPASITCQISGTWNYQTDFLCTKKGLCSTIIPNGGLIDCGKVHAGQSCEYYCHHNYKRHEEISRIICTSTGAWSTNTSILCQKQNAGTCDTQLPNGGLIDCKDPLAGETCQYYCHENYERKKGIISITCTSQGAWTQNVSSLCQMIVETQQSSHQEGLSIMMIVGVSAGTVVAITIIVLVILVCKFGRRNGNPHTEGESTIGNPPPYQNDNSYERFDREESIYSEIQNEGGYETLRPRCSYITPSGEKSEVLQVSFPSYLPHDSNVCVQNSPQADAVSMETSTTPKQLFLNAVYDTDNHDDEFTCHEYEVPSGTIIYNRPEPLTSNMP